MYHKTAVIGRTRSPHNTEVDINIIQNSVSKRHAIIKFVYESGQHSNMAGTAKFVLENWGKNGTYVGPPGSQVLHKSPKPVTLTPEMEIV